MTTHEGQIQWADGYPDYSSPVLSLCSVWEMAIWDTYFEAESHCGAQQSSHGSLSYSSATAWLENGVWSRDLPQPVQQGPARSDSTGPSHSSLSECGVASIHQLCQPLPPLRPETVHIQASLHSSHMLEQLTATLMFLFIRPFITLEVKIQMHYHPPIQ